MKSMRYPSFACLVGVGRLAQARYTPATSVVKCYVTTTEAQRQKLPSTIFNLVDKFMYKYVILIYVLAYRGYIGRYPCTLCASVVAA